MDRDRRPRRRGRAHALGGDAALRPFADAARTASGSLRPARSPALSREAARERIDRLGAAALDLFEASQTGALETDVDALLRHGIERRWFGTLGRAALDEARRQALPEEDATPA